MDAETREAFLQALTESQQFSAKQLHAAKEVLTSTTDDAQIAEQLHQLGIATHYQSRKLRINRATELIFGPYLIQDKLGEGGMGKVYKAVERKNGRIVALKVVRPHLMSNRTVLKRYQREAAAVAKLSHENIVVLYDVDDVNGRYYLSMEYVDGIDLSRMVKEFGKPPDRGLANYQEACEYVRQAALGLAHAHLRGLVHRDIKPSNILVHGDRALPGTNGKAKIKVLDMGLVRSLSDDDDATRTELTRDGTVVGTPDYMAPEQAKNSSTVDGRADIYSLGCTLFFLLCGRSVYPEGSPIEKLLNHQVEPPPDLGRLRPDLPKELLKVWRRMMEKDREKRYDSATAVASALYPFTPHGELNNDTAEVPAFSLDPVTHTEEFSFAPEAHEEILDAEIVSPPTPPPTQMPPRTPSSTPTRPPTKRKSSAPSQRPTNPKARPAPSVPGAMALPRPDAAPSSESLPSTTAPAPKTARTPKATDETPPALERRRERRQINKAKSTSMLPFLVGGAVGAVMLLVVAGFLIFGNRGTVPSSTPATETKPVSAAPTSDTPPPKPQRKLELLDLLPDRTQAALVIRPKKYLNRELYSSDTSTSSKAMNHLLRVNAKMSLDARNCSQITIPFSGPQNHWAVIGEGNFLKPGWEAHLLSLPKVQRSTRTGLKAFESLAWPTGPNFGLLLQDMAYGITMEPKLLIDLAERFQRQRPAEGIPTDLLVELRNVALEESIDLFFVVTAPFHLPVRSPDGPTLGDHGVRLFTATLKIINDGLEFHLVLAGGNKSRLKAFLSEYLATLIPEKYPGTRAIIETLLQGESSEDSLGNDVKLHLRGQISWASFHDTLDKVLPDLD